MIIAAVIVVLFIVGGFSMMTMMGGYWGGGYGWGGMMGRGMMGESGMGYAWWMPLGGFIFLVIFGAGLYLILSGSGKAAEQQPNRPLEILKERYAKGEITAEEFKKMRTELE